MINVLKIDEWVKIEFETINNISVMRICDQRVYFLTETVYLSESATRDSTYKTKKKILSFYKDCIHVCLGVEYIYPSGGRITIEKTNINSL